ncbi:MAG: thiamine phosphate synthase [Pseudomonadota bacterium]
MAAPEIYLITPPEVEIPAFAVRLAALLDTGLVACVRLALASADQGRLTAVAQALRPVCHDRDVALILDTHWRLVRELGLDGVHLPDGARHVREARRALGPKLTVGAFCGTSRHAGLAAGEAGADYVSFGPVGDPGELGDGRSVEADVFAWWGEIIELPVVAEGGVTVETARPLLPHIDFLAVGPEIWGQADPVQALVDLASALKTETAAR